MFLEYWRMYVFFHAKDCLYEVTLTVLTVTLFNSCVYQHRISFCIGYIGRPTNYVSLATQNECLKTMSLQLLRQVCSCIRNNRLNLSLTGFHRCLSRCQHRCEPLSGNHQGYFDPTGPHSVFYCRGQCYDVTSNMTGCRNGVTVEKWEETVLF